MCCDWSFDCWMNLSPLKLTTEYRLFRWLLCVAGPKNVKTENREKLVCLIKIEGDDNNWKFHMRRVDELINGNRQLFKKTLLVFYRNRNMWLRYWCSSKLFSMHNKRSWICHEIVLTRPKWRWKISPLYHDSWWNMARYDPEMKRYSKECHHRALLWRGKHSKHTGSSRKVQSYNLGGCRVCYSHGFSCTWHKYTATVKTLKQ